MNSDNPYLPPKSDIIPEEALSSFEQEPIGNPWISIWTKPRATIQHIVDTDPQRWIVILAGAAGLSHILDRASNRNLGNMFEWAMIFALAAFLGPIIGLIGLYLGSALIGWIGKWLGGRASLQNIRAAIAWSCVPIAWALILWIPELALFGNELFTTEKPSLSGSPSLVFVYFGFAAIQLTIEIWAIIIFLKCLGQVQGFSVWKALGNAILAGLVLIVAIVASAIAVGVISS